MVENNDTDLVVSLLDYHFTPGKIMSDDLECNAEIEMSDSVNSTTLCGQNGRIFQVGSRGLPNVHSFAQIVDTDQEVCSGVIHEINEVLLPA